MNCTEVFEKMDEKFQEFQLHDLYGVFQFNISGDQGGQWHAICSGETCRVSPGHHANPDVVITARDEHVVKLAQGRMNPALALLTRKVKVKGDLALIAKVKGLLSGVIKS